MSGIAGIVRFDGGSLQPDLIETMTAAMEYRGPDRVGHWQAGGVALGHCMLSVTPEGLQERQPLPNEDASLCLVLDGRIDNTIALRQQLRLNGRATLRDSTDAELLLKSYQTWGRDCLERLDGDYAFAIWDRKRGEVLCARDRFGIKPFYFQRYGPVFIFASDIKAILALPSADLKINEGMLAEHLSGRINNFTETLFTSINRLPPACYQTVSESQLRCQRYWSIDCRAQTYHRSDRQYAEHLLHLLRQAVSDRLRSTGNVGAYLSGGIDSSTIVALAAGQRQDRQLRLGSFRTYSLAFPGLGCDESAHIRSVSTRIGLADNIMPCIRTPADFYLSEVGRHFDVCESPNGVMLNTLRSLAREQGVRCLLTGYGGDEWFGRNPFHYADAFSGLRLWELPSLILADIYAGRGCLAILNDLTHRGLRTLVPDWLCRPVRAVRQILGGNGFESGLVDPSLSTRVNLADRVRGISRTCVRPADAAHAYMHSLVENAWNVRAMEIENRGVCSFELEERHPFYDRRIVEFALGIPERMRSRGGGKYVLRECSHGLLPDSVRLRRTKAEFSATLAELLVDPNAQRRLGCRNLVANGWIDAKALGGRREAFERSYRSGLADWRYHVWDLWTAFVLDAWVGVVTRPH